MGTKNKILAGALAAALLAAVAGGVIWCLSRYAIVNFHLYPRDSQVLRLNGQELRTKHYDSLRRQLPECEIYWDVPFQGSRYPNDTTELTVTSLTDEDVALLAYFPQLQVVNAQQCTDYARLQALRLARPEVQVDYGVTLGAQRYDWDARQIQVDAIGQEEINLLEYLPNLETVTIGGGADTANFAQLQQYCYDRGLEFSVRLGNRIVADDQTEVTAQDVTGDELNLLPFLPELERLRLVNPQAPAETVTSLSATYPDVDITWEIEIWGVTCASDQSWEEEMDLSEGTPGTLEEVEAAMAYFPEATQVYLGDCGLDNEEIAEYREWAREDYKVVWLVHCGRVPTRTDATSFMPSRDGVGNFRDEESYNLRYCEDMIAIDIGHMGNVRDVSFLAYMPELKYLILAHTSVSDISAISNCKKLIFLELDWSPISDYTPLLGCTALEDLNIGKYGADVTPICSMTWLKNVWCIFRPGAAGQIAAALPDTHVVASGNATVSSGWRNLPNYYDMRDALGMYYMSW